MNAVECFRECRSGVVQILSERDREPLANGSGFLVEGGIVTNSHVVRKASPEAIAIRFEDSNKSEYIRVHVGDVMAAESVEGEHDYAFLKVDGPEFDGHHRFTFAEAEDVEVGQMVGFLGYPFGMRNLTCHVGYISSIYERNGICVYQIDGSVNGGNSGGPLLSTETGNVIGIITRAVTGLIQRQFEELIRTLKRNQEILKAAHGRASMQLAGVDPVQGLLASQAAMEGIARNLERSANVGIGMAYCCEYARDAIRKILAQPDR